jgi:hypothetical protein
MKKMELNEVFTVKKGKRTLRWKIVEHPYFYCLTLVRDHPYLTSGECSKEDMKHMGGSFETIEKAYEWAQLMS